MSKTKQLVCGIGFNNKRYSSHIAGVLSKEYQTWQDMLLRCTQKYWDKFPTYTGTSCSENFKHYSFFYEWCHKQRGFNNIDENEKRWCLDKDILVKGNKVYSENTCCFVPARINTLLVKRASSRGEYLIGVCLDKRRGNFAARCGLSKGNNKYLGNFTTQQEAFQAYKVFKEEYIKQIAEQYKEQLSTKVYKALIDYEVDEND